LNHRIDVEWAAGKAREPGAVFSRQGVGRPPSGISRHGIEPIGLLESARDFVVIPAHDGQGIESPNALDHLVWVRAVSNEISQHEGPIEVSGGRIQEAGVKGLEVGVNVGQDEIAHRRVYGILAGVYDSSQSMICSTSRSAPARSASNLA